MSLLHIGRTVITLPRCAHSAFHRGYHLEIHHEDGYAVPKKPGGLGFWTLDMND